MYDCIIIGMGPAGLSAAIYTSRRGMKTVVIGKKLSEQVVGAPQIKNYPGIEAISGMELVQRMEEQAKSFGAEIIYDEVLSIKEEGKNFTVVAKEKRYDAKSIILAIGKGPRHLGIASEEKFQGRGIFYCDICDAPLMKNKVTAIIGGGDSALDAALYLSTLAKKVYVIHRRNQFRGCEITVGKIKEKKNIEMILDSVVEEFAGEKFLQSVKIKNLRSGEKKELKVDGVFIEVGHEVRSDFLKELVKLDGQKQIVVNQNCETFYPNTNDVRLGIFAAGDATTSLFKQIVISSGEGAKAGLQAYSYVTKKGTGTDRSVGYGK